MRPIWTLSHRRLPDTHPESRSSPCSAIFGPWVSSLAGPRSSSVSKRALLWSFLVSVKTIAVTGPFGHFAILVIGLETCLNSLPPLTSSKSLAQECAQLSPLGQLLASRPPRGSFSHPPPPPWGLVPREISRSHVLSNGKRGQGSSAALLCPP